MPPQSCRQPGWAHRVSPKGHSELGLRLHPAGTLGVPTHGPQDGKRLGDRGGRCAEGQEEGFDSRGKMKRWGEELDGERGGKWGGSRGKCAGEGKCEKKKMMMMMMMKRGW